MCTFFRISRAAYYAWRRRIGQEDPDEARLKLVQEAYQASKKTYGYRRIGLWIQQKREITINHKAVLRLMNCLGIHSVVRQHKFYRCKAPGGAWHHYENVLNRDFSATGPNQKWVTEIV